MKTVGFVGPSGTGKSYRAMWVARQNDIRLVIDDGLLLSEHHIIAGVSAKKEKTKLGSVRRALFTDPKHAADVRKAIANSNRDKILILGTSDGMVKKIAEVLELPEPEEIIRIEDIATPEEIEKALRVRKEQGKHVIPAPTFAVKKDFSGYFTDSVKIFLRGKHRPQYEAEKTVVRPTFSYLGEFTIATRVLVDIATNEASRVQGVARVFKTNVNNGGDGATFNMEISVIHHVRIPDVVKLIQEHISETVETLTGINVLKVNVTVKAIE